MRGDGMPAPLINLLGARAMTLLERRPAETLEAGRPATLETTRLRLRALCRAAAKAIASLANDRRIAENTARIPHPYGLADAEEFIAFAGTSKVETVFAIALKRGRLIGTCGLSRQRGGKIEIGYWLGVPFWGEGYATEAVRALIDHAFEDLAFERIEAGGPGVGPAPPPGPGKVRLPVERGRARAHPRHCLLGASRSLPTRPPAMGFAQGLGSDAAGLVTWALGTPARPASPRPNGVCGWGLATPRYRRLGRTG